MIIVLNVLPILWCTFNIVWTGQKVLSTTNPAFRQDAQNPESSSMISLSKVLREGHWGLESTGLFFPGSQWKNHIAVSIAFYVLFLFGSFLWWKKGATIGAFCLLCHVLGTLVMSDVYARLLVMAEPFIIYVMVLGFTGLLKFILGRHNRWRAVVSLVASGALICAVLYSWAKWQPWRDRCSVEGNKRMVTVARLAETVPQERVVIVEVDHYSEALMSGRATICLPPWKMWNNADGKKFLEAGGRAAAIWAQRENTSDKLIDYLPFPPEQRSTWNDRLAESTLSVNGLDFLLGTVDYDLDFLLPASQADQSVIPTHIHSRWFKLKPADAETLYHEAFPLQASDASAP